MTSKGNPILKWKGLAYRTPQQPPINPPFQNHPTPLQVTIISPWVFCKYSPKARARQNNGRTNSINSRTRLQTETKRGYESARESII